MSHLTIAASENAFKEMFKLVRDGFTLSNSDSKSFGTLSASYSYALHLEKGTIHLNNDGTVEIEALDVVWDTLTLQVCFDFEGLTIPGLCIVPGPWNTCLVGWPDIPIAAGSICIPLDLSGIVSEISKVRARLKVKYSVDPGRHPAWTDLEAENAGKPNKWNIFVNPDFVSVDPIDIPASIGNIFENLVEQAIRNLLPDWLPDAVKDALMAFLEPVEEIVEAVVNIFDSTEDFLQDLLGQRFDFLGAIETAVADHLANKYPIYKFEDPYPILTEGSLIPVKIPLRNLKTDVNSKEMIITGEIGQP